MCCISFLQGHYPRMRMPTRCMPAVTFQAEIPSKKANPLWTACVKISFFFFFKKSLTDVLAPWHKDPAMSQHYKQTRTWQQRGVRPTPHRENSNGNFTLESLFCRTQNWNTPLRPLPWTFFFFISLATIHELQIKIMRFHWLSGFWRVQRVVKFRLPRSVEKDHLYMATTAQLTEVSTARYNPTTLQLGINT